MENKISNNFLNHFGPGMNKSEIEAVVEFACSICQENVGYVLQSEKRSIVQNLHTKLNGHAFLPFDQMGDFNRELSRGLVNLHRGRKELPPGHPYIDFIEEVEVSLAWLSVGRPHEECISDSR